jgi:hypothetical protein
MGMSGVIGKIMGGWHLPEYRVMHHLNKPDKAREKSRKNKVSQQKENRHQPNEIN